MSGKGKGKGKSVPKRRRAAYAPLGPKAQRASTSSAFKIKHTDATEITRGTFQPSSASVPYSQKDKAPQKQSYVRVEIEGSCIFDPHMNTNPNPTLLAEFFPPTDLKSFTTTLDEKWSKATGWKGWPNPSLTKVAERDIAECLVNLLNFIISDLGFVETRVAVDRQNFAIPTHDGMKLKPDVFLWGRGSPAFPFMKDRPPERTAIAKKRRFNQRDLDDAEYEEKKPLPEKPPGVEWPWCVIPIEIKTEATRGGEGNSNHFIQLGTYAREVLVAQPNRRFVPSLLLTELTAEFILWDRAGVVISERMYYHEKEVADVFCRMLVSFVTWSDVELGFDPTVFYNLDVPEGFDAPEDLALHIRTNRYLVQDAAEEGQSVPIAHRTEDAEYVVEETFTRPYIIRGRGTTTWRARKLGEDHARYIILDSWVAGGAVVEHEVLRTIEDAGPATGFAYLVHIGDVRFPFNPSDEHCYRDTVNANRIGERFRTPIDLIHTRTVLRCNGTPTPLGQYASPRELVGALLDVIQGHEQMYRTAKIVHRDILPWNILIQRDAPTASRGILIDFSCATSTIKGKIMPRPEKSPSSSYFMCIKALLGERPADSHLDELESIYWILCVFISLRRGIQERLGLTLAPKLHAVVVNDVDPEAGYSKENHFYAPFSLEVPASFPPPVGQLAKKLHGFFQTKMVEQAVQPEEGSENDEAAWQDIEKKKIQEDYTEIIGYFSEAFEALTPSTRSSQ